jgi:UDP-N-acetyl-D-glucosamine dehydrogenase
VLGVAYKPNLGDTRETPAFEFVRNIQGQGAKVEIHDPYVTDLRAFAGMSVDALSEEVLYEYDAVVILANHDLFDYRLIESAARYVLDCRNSYAWTSSTVEVI